MRWLEEESLSNHAGRAVDGKMMGHTHKDKRSGVACQMEDGDANCRGLGAGGGDGTWDKVEDDVSDTARS